jgi:cytoskeletal protein RodZ
MDDELDTTPGTEAGSGSGLGARALRSVLPWVFLVAILVAGVGILSSFRDSLRQTVSAPLDGESAITTSSVDTSATAVPTSTIAVTRVSGVQVLSTTDAGGVVLATQDQDVELKVLERTDTWLKVKDASGNIGWIANSSKTVEIRTK